MKFEWHMTEDQWCSLVSDYKAIYTGDMNYNMSSSREDDGIYGSIDIGQVHVEIVPDDRRILDTDIFTFNAHIGTSQALDAEETDYDFEDIGPLPPVSELSFELFKAKMEYELRNHFRLHNLEDLAETPIPAVSEAIPELEAIPAKTYSVEVFILKEDTGYDGSVSVVIEDPDNPFDAEKFWMDTRGESAEEVQALMESGYLNWDSQIVHLPESIVQAIQEDAKKEGRL